jgi:YNFM family putative membrane transporter
MGSIAPPLAGDRLRVATLALYAAAVVVLADMYLTQPILPLLAAEFGIAPATAGLSVSFVVFFIAAASTAFGPLSDRLGRKPVMVGSVALLAIPTFLCAFAPTFGALLVLRGLQGLCIPGLTAVAVAYLGDVVTPKALGGVVGGWIAANVAGGLIGRVASGVITDFFGWRAVFAVFGVLTFSVALLLFAALPPAGRQAAGSWRGAYGGMLAHLLNRRLLGAFLIGGALFFGFIGIFTYLPFYLTSAPFFVSPGLVAFAYVSYLAGVVVSPVAGRLSARIDRRVLIAAGLLIAGLGIAITLVRLLPAIIIGLFVLCTGMFTAQAVAPAFVNTVAVRAKGGANALYLSFYYLGGTLGAALPGLAWQASGWEGVAAVCAGALLLALLANWLLCRK